MVLELNMDEAKQFDEITLMKNNLKNYNALKNKKLEVILQVNIFKVESVGVDLDFLSLKKKLWNSLCVSQGQMQVLNVYFYI